jgi:hypothetical protein
MGVFTRLKSVARGSLWLLRAPGLRQSISNMEERARILEQSLSGFGSALDSFGRHAIKGMKEQIHQAELARWRETNDLRAYEKTVFSQNGEDGIIQEILRRIGTETKFFVEFGVSKCQQE